MRLLSILLFFVTMQCNAYSYTADNEEFACQESSIRIDVLKGNEVVPYLKRFAELRISFYRDYPYLYDGTLEGEEGYLRMFCESENALFAVAQQGGEMVGSVTGLPLLESMDENEKLFAEMKERDVFYLSDSILSKELQDENALEEMYRQFESAVKMLGKYRTIIVCEIERGANDLKRAADDSTSELAWEKRGFTRLPDLAVYYSWKELGGSESTDHRMVFWSKTL